MVESSNLLVERDGAICTLVINRPEKLNLLTPAFLSEMTRVLKELAREDSVMAVIIRGYGSEAFSAGYDVSALPTPPTPDMRKSLRESPPMERVLRAIQDFPYPVIAMVNGHAYGGGCELAIGCDIRIAAKSARMGMPPAKLGLIYPYSGYRRFLTVLGLSHALEIFLTGRRYDSETCLKMGLVNHVVEDGHLEPFTYELARELSENAPLSLRATKTVLYRITASPLPGKEEEEELKSLFIKSLESEDMQEAKQAFMEKRKPQFRGK
jgi:enoyl-CoA hydratase/carnithine racemase